MSSGGIGRGGGAGRLVTATPALIAVLGLALVLRLFNLTAQSYWGDEAFSWATSSLPVPDLLSVVTADGSHPPLHYLMLHAWLRLVRWSDEAAAGRVFSLIFGVAAVPALYALGRAVFDRQTALVGALLLAVSQLHIAYSQEVRPYSQLILFTVLAAFFYLRAVERRSALHLAAATLAAILAVETHYYGALSVAAIGLWHLLFARRKLPVAWVVLAGGAIFCAIAVWLGMGALKAGIDQPSTVDAAQPNYYAVDWSTPFENLAAYGNARSAMVVAAAGAPLMVFLGSAFFSGPILLLLRGPWSCVPLPAWGRDALLTAAAAVLALLAGGVGWALAGAGLTAAWLRLGRAAPAPWSRLLAAGFLAVLAGAAILARNTAAPQFEAWLLGCLAASAVAWFVEDRAPADADGAGVALLVLMVVVPLTLLLLLGLRGVKYDVRYGVEAMAPFYLLAARGMTALEPRALRIGWIATTVAFSALGVRNVLTVPYKENYRDAFAQIHREIRPGDCTVILNGGEKVPAQWRLYGFDDVPLQAVSRTELVTGAPTCRSVWLLMYQRVGVMTAWAAQWEALAAARRPLLAARQYQWMKLAHYGPLAARQ